MGWRMLWGYEVADKPTAPGIFRLKTGGYLVTVRARNKTGPGRTTGTKVMHDATLAEAKAAAEDLRTNARVIARGQTKRRLRWSEFAASLYARKQESGDLQSPKTLERWEYTLKKLLQGFGHTWCDELRYADIEEWKLTIAKTFKLPERTPHPNPDKAAAGRTVRNPERYAPTTANGWLSILRVICKQMTAELELGRDPAAAVRDFDLSTHRTYTHEKPNALTPDLAQKFLATMKELYPQHYPMALLGFITGLRPSSMRPLRRKGPSVDVNWDEGRVLVRRSNAMGQVVVEKTKTAKDLVIYLPTEIIAVLKDYVESFEDGPQRESELLFPARHGGMRSRSVLDKPFQRVCEAIAIPFPLTPRAMRRTNKDLMRAASVSDVISKAISGHTTDDMHELYSTASSGEVRAAIDKVGALITGTTKPETP